MNKSNARAISVAVFWLTLVVQIPKFCAEVNQTVAPRTQAPTLSGLRSCTKNQMKYVYTECDVTNGRWKVGVPLKPELCRMERPPIPERGTQCTFSCPEGQYLDIQSQKCLKCKPGTFSLSGGIRFRSWQTLPSGFLTWGSDPDNDEVSSRSQSKCNKTVWSAEGDFIESAGDFCKSVLAYSVTLEKDGNISIVYRSDDEDALFHVKVANDFCTTSHGGKHRFNLYPEFRWKRTYVPLQRGRNVIFMESFTFESAESNHHEERFSGSGGGVKNNVLRTVQIKEIKITGLSYTSECTNCEPGTYSGEGAAYCKKCDANTFSKEGADSCTKCASNEYSAPGSVKCLKKPKCSSKDFYEMWSDCDAKSKTQRTFFWVIPKICEGGIALPPPAEEMDCPPCNPGQFKNGSQCAFCGQGQYSDGKSACKKCPPSTSPDVGLFFRWWRNLPKNLFEFFCLSEKERSCKSSTGWRQFNTFMDTGVGHADDAEVGLMLRVPGFKSATSTFVIEFEVQCKSFCTFIIEMRRPMQGKMTILTKHGMQPKTKFIYKINGDGPASFRMKFIKNEGDPDDDYEYSQDRFILYAMNVTNSFNGGASQCSECPLGVGSEGKGCVQCGEGSYLENKKCFKCPKGTYLDAKNPFHSNACKKCSPGTKSSEGSSHCYSDCHVHSPDGRHFDFTALGGYMQRKNSKMFTSHGYPFYRLFNVTVCGKEDAVSTCMNNFTKEESKDHSSKAIKAMICRSTVIPSHERKENIIAQSMSLGDYLEKITFGNPYKTSNDDNQTRSAAAEEKSHRTRRDENMNHDVLPTDVNFFFKSLQSSARCTKGYSTIITMRCDQTAVDRGYIAPSPGCVTGTCDGCLYQLFWHSVHACPLCTYSDYQNITSACIKGKVTKHYVWNYPKMCKDGVELPESTSRNCSVLERTVLDLKIFIIVFILMVFLLILLIIVLLIAEHQRRMDFVSSRLNYKYSRLIDEAHYKDGELPASEKCTLEEGEEEDEVILARRSGGNGRRILDRLKKIGSPKNRNDFPEFETINLTERVRNNSSGDEI
ncbi:endosome/lysosome-associated apoptosis and autophagy regulator family member 2-like [Rhopilema esculentum]|uniref:endosome/lysosome-associated apoptosis and autophagy regulator family member 2-like n=1 Tax=Rhopilema esculentum TaxID=499914 RepID=UPI0031D4CA11